MAKENYVPHEWKIETFHMGDDLMVKNLNEMEEGIESAEPEHYLKAAEVLESGDVLAITDQDGNIVEYNPDFSKVIASPYHAVGGQVAASIAVNGVTWDLPQGTGSTEIVYSAGNGLQLAEANHEFSINPAITATVASLTAETTARESGDNALQTAIAAKLDASKCTFQTTAPTSSIQDGGVHVVMLQAEPATYYDGYLYFIMEN